MDIKQTAWVALSLLLISGCATMDQSECLNADWQIIGMEDGAQGKLLSHIGRHRSACAKYFITPNLELYQQGHNEGVTQYCTGYNGFSVGKSGSEYNSICPPQSEPLFLEGYEQGRSIYLLNKDIWQLRSSISSNQEKMSKLKDSSHSKEQQLLHQNLATATRAELVHSIKKIERKLGRLQVTIRTQKEDLKAKERYLDEISHRY